MKQLQAALFDMDGLLLDSERIALESFHYVCQKHNLPKMEHVFIRCVGVNAKAGSSILKEELEGRTDYQTFDRDWNEDYRSRTIGKAVPLKTGVVELLEFLKSNQIPMAVATSTTTERAKQKFGRANIKDYFTIVIGGDQVERSKPDPDIYLRAASSVGVLPEKCIAFEDSPNGVRAAVAAGMEVIQVPDLVEPDAELRKLGHTVLKSLREARSHLEHLS